MALSKTDIVNKALTLAGAAPIVSIDDDTNNAETVRRVYESALRSVLSECKWNFATTRAALSEVVVTLDFYDTGEENVYQKPTDMIRIYDVSPSNARWREEGDYIITDSDDFAVRYVYYLDTPSKYPMYFIDALIDKLVGDIAYVIVNSATLAKSYVEKYERVSLPKAVSANSQTGIQQGMRDDAWVMSKHSDNSQDV